MNRRFISLAAAVLAGAAVASATELSDHIAVEPNFKRPKKSTGVRLHHTRDVPKEKSKSLKRLLKQKGRK